MPSRQPFARDLGGAATTVVVVAPILGVTAEVREYAKRIDSTANAVARYGKHSDTEFDTNRAALREAAANRQQLESQITAVREAAASRQQESLIQANAQLAPQIADLKGQIDALKVARAAPRAAPSRSKRRR
jgi:dienelactone hydrolase